MSSRLVLLNARIGLGGPIRHLVIEKGRVVDVSGLIDADFRGERIDVQGATVLPGLYDAHVHMVQWAQARRRIDLSPARSAREAVDLAVAGRSGDGPTVGYGFRDALWPDAPDTSMFPPGAFVLVSNDLHTAWLSPEALRLVGRGDHPTGVLREQDCYTAMAALPPPPREEVDRWVVEAASAAAARGVTGVLDFEFADTVTDWSRRVAEHRVDVRVTCAITRILLDQAIHAGLRTGEEVAGSGGLLEVGPLKLFADGSLNTRTAYCDHPYPGTGDRGLLELPPDELRATMARAAAHGLHPAVHAIGDSANALVLDAFEELGCPGRIEHAQLVRSDDFVRFARPGLVAGVQPAHGPDDRDVAEIHWRGRTARAYAYADLLAAGAVLQFGSDAPVAPLDPWDGIASAVTRTDDDRPTWHPEQAVPLGAALTAACGGRSGVARGDRADLMVLADDPCAIAPEGLRRIEVVATLLRGGFTYRNGV
ncbi:hypothetical protein SAMN05421505_1367 [Sinosporangium album]|uniref:Amidohydrolase 3 domain-containing protein n=1 Tax=Sinosporangium album TaxID=504805 RepID=A0A1G8I9B5_9ACTN|nr:amidohydrolase family protein [Sinosporangium album]SDI15442.1 hypothetical protein SAMN05421505_1367 [Sinosporangium album]